MYMYVCVYVYILYLYLKGLRPESGNAGSSFMQGRGGVGASAPPPSPLPSPLPLIAPPALPGQHHEHACVRAPRAARSLSDSHAGHF